MQACHEDIGYWMYGIHVVALRLTRKCCLWYFLDMLSALKLDNKTVDSGTSGKFLKVC